MEGVLRTFCRIRKVLMDVFLGYLVFIAYL